MKKQLGILLCTVLTFTLTACGNTENLPESSPLPDTALTETSTEQTAEQETRYSAEQLNKKLDIQIGKIKITDLINPDKLAMLEADGFSAELKNVEKIDGENLKITIGIKNAAGKDMEIGLPAIMNYGTNPKLYAAYTEGLNEFYVYWGNIGLCGDKLIVSLLRDVLVYDADSLELTDIKFDTSFMSGDDGYILDTTAYKDGYISAYVAYTHQGFAFFDNEGKLTELRTLRQGALGEYSHCFLGCLEAKQCEQWSYRCYNGDVYFTENIYIQPVDGFVIVDNRNNRSLAYDTENDVLYETWQNGEATQNSNVAKLMGCRRKETYWDRGDDYFYLAILQKGKDFSSVKLADNSENEGYMSFIKPEMVLDGNTLTFESPGLNSTGAIDFTAKTVTYTPGEFTLNEDYLITKSKDGSFSLYMGGYDGAGDISYSQIYLYNNTTGESKYIGVGGGMYGGVGGCGFMSNGDVYMFSGSDFKIYNTDINNPNPIFRLSDYYKFGGNISKDIQYRTLFAARRDPVDGTYLALYCERNWFKSYAEQFVDNNEHGFKLKCTYKVAHFDNSGNLVKVYDTGVNAISTAMGFANVDMYLQGENLHFHTWKKNPENIYTKGYLNLATGVYTAEKELKLQ